MQITWFGLSSFKIVSKEVTIITDPFGKETGLTAVRGNADVVITSDPNNSWSNNFSSISGTPFIINGPGEYNVKEVFVMGTSAESKASRTATIYTIEVEGIRIAFFGPVKISELSDKQKEVLEGADIVLIPVGGKEVMGFEEAAKIATKLEPYYIIPHSYKTPGLTLSLDKLDKFLQEMGSKHEEMEKLSLKKKELTAQTTSLVILTPQR
ncbi:MAG TPA: MBL fold metallo-hydrolase [Verrucomicrobiae bacterium]|nr:MBL fold metallo-hydrolase [Verrucomicrobiae bacterium]